MKESSLSTFIKGFIIGGTMIIPGVSGGTMAMILGIYDELIHTLSSFRNYPMYHFRYLSWFAAGAGTGMILFVTPLSWLLEHYKFSVISFFMGVVFGGIPMIAKKCGVKKVSGKNFLCMSSGTIMVLFIAAIPQGIFHTEGNGIFMLLAGIVVAAALILPGISISHFFLILGIYERILDAVKEMELTFLLPLAVGVGIGIILFSKILNYLLEKYSTQTYLVILGFILGSVAEIFSEIPKGVSILGAAMLFLTGFSIMYQIQKKSCR